MLVRKYLWITLTLLVIGFCVQISGCQDDPGVIWSAETKSPDGVWVAEARTLQYGGMGQALVQTTVRLKRRSEPDSPVEIATFSNESAYPVGVTKVKMNWLSENRLDISYGEISGINFQAIKCGGIDISYSRAAGSPKL